MGQGGFFTRWEGIRRWAADLAMLPFLGLVAYCLFLASASLRPAEAALLMMAAAGLLLLGRRWYSWQRSLAPEGLLSDWVGRILQGDRTPRVLPEGLEGEARPVAMALGTLLREGHQTREGLDALHRAVAREWAELDELLDLVQRQSVEDRAARADAAARFAAYGRDLREIVEGSLRFDQIELDQRLRADQHRLIGQAFKAALEQAQARLEQVGSLLKELRETFPRLQAEEAALGRLADSGLRQGARLDLAAQGLAAHTPRLLEGTKARSDQLRRFRTSADGVRDQAEALARRIEALRVESQRRIMGFGGAQGAILVIDQAAQQTGLLAVNAAIIAQQSGGSAGMQAIGGRLRGLADQTSQGAADLERALDEHQRGMERESAGLWDLQETARRLGAGIQELLHVASQLDQQGQDLERMLEAQTGLVDQMRDASEGAGKSLHEVGECASALRTALGWQGGVEAQSSAGVDQLLRTGQRMAEAGFELARVNRRSVEEIGAILEGHQKLRQSGAFRQLASGDLGHLLGPEGLVEPAWNRVAWARAQRHDRLLKAEPPLQPLGRRDAEGGLRLLLVGRDALGRPMPSALETWCCDPEARVWRLALVEGLRSEAHRFGLQEALQESPLMACLPGAEVRVSQEGVTLRLAFPYPALPMFLAGLGLELAMESVPAGPVFREARAEARPVQRLLWCGPDQDPHQRARLLRLVHGWVRDDPQHEGFLAGLPYEGQRPPCPWLAEGAGEEGFPEPPKVRCLGMGVDASLLHPLRDRLLNAGAEEGEGGAVLCAISLAYDHPEALLLRLFHSGEGLAGSPHPELAPLRARFETEVLGGGNGTGYRAAWRLLETFQQKGWALPLPD